MNNIVTKSGKMLFTLNECKAYIDKLEKELSDGRPVNHGRWIWNPNAPHREHGAYKCSNCSYHSDFEENYCANCGTRMKDD